MFLKSSIFFSALFMALMFGPMTNPLAPETVDPSKEALIIQSMVGGLNQLHYRPKSIDDEFSAEVYDLYLDRIDNARRWLTKKDLRKLEPFKYSIDEQINAGQYDFFNLSVELLESGVEKTQKIYQELLAEPFDFSKKEYIEFDEEKKPFAKDDRQLIDYWRKALKYEVMVKIINKQKAQEERLTEAKEATAEEKAEMEPVKELSFEEIEKEAREEVLKNFEDLYKRIEKLRRSDRLSDYLNTIANIFDPHTGYYLPKDKENFDINMSGTLEGIGARLQTDGEHTKVVSVVPGGPAWKQKDLEPKDLILMVAQKDEKPVDVSGFRIDDVVKLIRGKKGTQVTLTVKKVDGTMMDVTIIRDVVQLEESYAKSAVLQREGADKKIGYIKLPRFYADFNRKGGRSCATDVAAELDKLKEENVDGIILDLRNNGGGSLRDVVRMSGLFIEEGPIVQVKARNRPAEVLRDKDARVQYDGPLVVMVNSFSASASEILAAALQDYERAVIVGSNRTFGKGTVQRFLNLDRAVTGQLDAKPLGDIKLTIQKFYRVDGGSTQLLGVEPDIVLPDRYHFMKTGEEEQDYAMEWTEINEVAHNQSVTELDNLASIKEASKSRVENSEPFQKVIANARRLKKQRDISAYPLNMEEYDQFRKNREAEAKKYEKIFPEIEGLSVMNPSADMEAIQMDSVKIAQNDEWFKGLQKDHYVDEVLNIMDDMMKEEK